MERISAREVRFTDDEMLVNNLVDDMLDAGYSTLAAVAMIKTQRLPKKFDTEENRWLTRGFTQRVLTPQFLAYLQDEDRSEVPEEKA